jgi:hypothetical protein
MKESKKLGSTIEKNVYFSKLKKLLAVQNKASLKPGDIANRERLIKI